MTEIEKLLLRSNAIILTNQMIFLAQLGKSYISSSDILNMMENCNKVLEEIKEFVNEKVNEKV